ncbi:MAG TPA: hypothetical protein VFR81_17055 [Longimicrobium sp.]|nr:hypothetical protein [Longimicrobium sp.]
MLFSLEALQARHGDSLLLHFGTPESPRLVVIDGGPSGVFPALRKRLDALRAKRTTDGAPLPIRLLMVSHIDDDHIRGVLDLTDHLLKERSDRRPTSYEVTTLWHNAFEDVLGGVVAASTASVAEVEGASAGEVLASLEVGPEAELVLAGVPQGRRLRDNARALDWALNKPFDGLVEGPGDGNPVKLGGGLTLTVVGPGKERIEALRKEWEKTVAKAPKEKLKAEAAAYVDRSVANLSSIVVLAEAGGKRMLLTGDARGDFVLEGLEAAGLLDGEGRIHVDLLKVPHHGSAHNVEEDFFRRVTADHYVISADGKHDNPDVEMLQMLSTARAGARYTVHLTNSVPAADAFLTPDSARQGYQVVRRADGRDSVVVDLLDPLRD